MQNNLIKKNFASDDGGGICIRLYSTGNVNDNIINNNLSFKNGGGIYVARSSPEIRNSIIQRNQCNLNGGGIGLYESDVKLINNIVSLNYACNEGGGIDATMNSEPMIANNSICFNSSRFDGGGLYAENFSDITILNNIIFGNSAESGEEIYICYGTLYVSHSDIDSNECEVNPLYGGTIIYGPGNINSDPLFSDSLLSLSEDSPCIDAGAESVYISLWDTTIYAPNEDFEGDPRPQNNFWDMGADEYYPEYIRDIGPKPEKYFMLIYPNPFNSSCRIETQVNSLIEIYNITGGVVEYIHPSPIACSVGDRFAYTWSPDKSLSSGIYLVRIKAGSRNITKKAVYFR